jgi:hypothetical protein
MDAVERKEIVERFRTGHGKLERSIDGLGEYELEYRPAPNKWNIREIAIHLCDSEIVAAHRIRRVLAEENPILTSYDQDKWANRLNYGKRNLLQAVELFRLLRKSTSELFQEMDENDWQRVGTHDENGRMSLIDLVRLYAEHCENHVSQIRQIRLELSKQ